MPRKIIGTVITIIIVLAILDLMILSATVLQIASGEYTPHIPFWDKQIEFFIK